MILDDVDKGQAIIWPVIWSVPGLLACDAASLYDYCSLYAVYTQKTLPTFAEQTLLLPDSHTWLVKHECLATEDVSMICVEVVPVVTHITLCKRNWMIFYHRLGGILWETFKIVQICTLDQSADKVHNRSPPLLSGNLLFYATNLRNSYTRDAEQVGIGASEI